MSATDHVTGLAGEVEPGSVEEERAVAEAAPRRTRTWGAIDVLGPLAVFGLFIGVWYFMSYVGMPEQKRFLVPPPHDVVQASFFDWDRLHTMLDALWVSAQVAAMGLAIAIVLGVGLAVVMSQARWLERAVFPYAVALQAIPILAFVPLIGAILDFNLRSRVVVCVIISLFPIMANTLFGLLSAERGQHDLFTLHGASRVTRLRKLTLPAAMPAIFAGFRISAGLSVIGSVVGDQFFRKGEPGIGRLIDAYRARNDMELAYGAVILSSLLGVVVFIAFGVLANRVVGHWHESTRRS